MTGLPDEVVIPNPNMVDKEFWAHCAQQKLMFQACADCGHLRHPPTPFCPKCQSLAVTWREAPDEAVVYSYTISHLSRERGLVDVTPYIIAVVEFPEFGPVRFVTNVETDPAHMRIGLPLKLFWKSISDSMWLPLFRPAADAIYNTPGEEIEHG